MLKAHVTSPKPRTLGRALTRRAVSLAAIVSLITPVAIATLARPAAATGFTVPAGIPDDNSDGSLIHGNDTGYVVSNSVTLTATGTWSTNGGPTTGPDGDPGWIIGSDPFLRTDVFGFALLGRIGTRGAWTLIGSGPTTLNGDGELYLVMNDNPGFFGDNTGTLDVTIAASANLSTVFFTDGPALAGNIGWQGDYTNTSDQTLHNADAVIFPGVQPTTAPTWSNSSSGEPTSGNCTPTGPFGLYECAFGDIAPGDDASVSATAPTQGLAPGTISDAFVVQGDETAAFAEVAPTTTQQIDTLRFDLLSPPSINDGDPLTVTGTVTNTSQSFDITGITLTFTIDIGTITEGTPGCSFTAHVETCPSSGTFAMVAGSALDGTTVINTAGLDGQTLHYSILGNSPDIGGDSYVASGQVDIVNGAAIPPPNVTITSPTSATVARTLPNTFTATASPSNGGASIVFVDLQVDGNARTIDNTPPYTTTIPANSLSLGTHALHATAHQSDGQTTTVDKTIDVVGPPTVTIHPPSGFSSGGSLDTAKTFTATATPDSPATIASVAYKIDSAAPFATQPSSAGPTYSQSVDPAVLTLTVGSHTIRAVATDSTGQSTTSAPFSFTIPTTTLDVPATTPPVPTETNSVTPGGDPEWILHVDNNSAAVAHHVSLTIVATATDINNVSHTVPVDEKSINGAIGASPNTDTCPTNALCKIVDIPASPAFLLYPVFVKTTGVSSGSTISVTVNVGAANAGGVVQTGSLDPVSVATCGTVCFNGVVATGVPFATSTGPVSTTIKNKDSVVLAPLEHAAGATGGGAAPHLNRPIIPGAAMHFTNQPIASTALKMLSISPTSSTAPATVKHLCPTATTCTGLATSVSANFTSYNNRSNPVALGITVNWGANRPAPLCVALTCTITSAMIMQKDARTGFPLPAPIRLRLCNAAPPYTTPCLLAVEGHTGSTTNVPPNYTTYDTILFVGVDPAFARRR